MYRISIINNGKSKILHEPDTGSLRRLSSGKLTEEINQIPSFTFTIPHSNPCYQDELRDRKTIVSVLNTITSEIEFEGALLTHEETMSDSGRLVKSGVCEGYLGYLCDSVQMYHTYKGARPVDFLQTLLDNHNEQVSTDKQIFLGQCDVSGDNTNSKTTAYRTTLEEIKINLIDRLGGEIRVRRADGKLVLDYLKQYGTRSSATIELAKNMRSLNVKTDATNIITAGVLRGLEIVNGDGTFHVSPDGSVTASAINITGGSINISTQDEEYDVIQLNNGEWHSQLSPLQLKLVNDDNKCELIIQAGGIWFKKNGEDMVTISSGSGKVFSKSLATDMLSVSGDAHARNLYFTMDEKPQSLAGWISGLDRRVKDLEG